MPQLPGVVAMTTEQRQGALAAKAWADTHPAHPGGRVITTPGIGLKLAAICLIADMALLACALITHAAAPAWLAGFAALCAARVLTRPARARGTGTSSRNAYSYRGTGKAQGSRRGRGSARNSASRRRRSAAG
jgi:hypothetical protein